MILVINIPLTEIVEASGDEVRIVFIEDVQIRRDLFAQSAAADDIHIFADLVSHTQNERFQHSDIAVVDTDVHGVDRIVSQIGIDRF